MTRKKITLEYPMQCTVASLFSALTTPSGLRHWFADDVRIDGDTFGFKWDKVYYLADRIGLKPNESVRYRWHHDPEGYFEMRIEYLELTGTLSLVITDFAAEEDEDDSIDMWDNNVSKLKRFIGCGKR